LVTSSVWYNRRLITGTAAGINDMAMSVFPNPTASTATVSYYSPVARAVQVKVVDVVGRQVVNLASQPQGAGPHTLAVPALRPGMYTVRLIALGESMYRKLVVE
jgi:hypothetical protein